MSVNLAEVRRRSAPSARTCCILSIFHFALRRPHSVLMRDVICPFSRAQPATQISPGHSESLRISPEHPKLSAHSWLSLARPNYISLLMVIISPCPPFRPPPVPLSPSIQYREREIGFHFVRGRPSVLPVFFSVRNESNCTRGVGMAVFVWLIRGIQC